MLAMEVFVEEFNLGSVKIQLSIQEKQGMSVVMLTVNDTENRRILKTPLMVNGEVKMFENEAEAIQEAKKTIGAI